MDHTILEQSNEPLVNYLRVHRRDAGLTQWDVGRMIGYESHDSVSRHERFESIPPFLIALAYEIIFREPAGEIFVGLKETMESGIEDRISEFERELRDGHGQHPPSVLIARKLEWLTERRGKAIN